MHGSPKLINHLSFVIHAWWKKPLLALRTFRFLVLRLLKRPVIRGMDIAITYDCNLSCPHCNVALQHDPSREEMDLYDIQRAIEQLKKAGGFYVTFTGGEVLLNRDRLKSIITAAGKHSMLYQVQTNGTLLTNSVCHELNAMGIDNVQISFDTFHETRSWSTVLKTKEKQLRMVRRHGMDVFFTWLASHHSLASHEIRDVIRFSNRHAVKIGLNFAVPQGRWAGQHRMLLTSEDSHRIRYISRKNKYLYIDLENNLFNYGCPAFSERLHINAYGDVQPCTFFQISFGNIKNEPLADILNRGRNHRLFRGFPDHCPPAENPEYIRRWRDSAFTSLPVFHEEFFKDDSPSQPCVVCGKPVSIPFLTDLSEVEYGLGWKGSIMKCESCGLIQQTPMLTVPQALSWYPDEYIHYNPTPHEFRGFLMQIYMGRTLRLLKKLNIRQGQRLLDIGCGAGEKLAILRNRLNIVVEGIEPDPKAAQKARDKFDLDVSDGVFSPDSYPESCFDVVRINHVIEHVPDPVGLLNGIYRVLKPGGILIGETENIQCPSFKVFGRFWALLHLPYHLVLFSETSMKKTFDKSLFGEVSIASIGDPPAWSLSLQNVLRRNKKKDSRTSSRMRGYIFLTLMAAPLSYLETRLFQGPVLEFHSRKKQWPQI
jgi:MoaA/NifB/PqqE/SkfB family radical SAM enzyme/SAM-dependent methyltransferase